MQKIVFLLLLILTACAPAVNTPTPLILTSTSPAPIETTTLTPTRTPTPTETSIPTPEIQDLNVSCAAPEAVANVKADFPAIFRANMTAFLESLGITVGPNDQRVDKTVQKLLDEMGKYPFFVYNPTWTYIKLDSAGTEYPVFATRVTGVFTGVNITPLNTDVPGAPDGFRQVCMYVNTDTGQTIVARVALIDNQNNVILLSRFNRLVSIEGSVSDYLEITTMEELDKLIMKSVGKYVTIGVDTHYNNASSYESTLPETGMPASELFPYMGSRVQDLDELLARKVIFSIKSIRLFDFSPEGSD